MVDKKAFIKLNRDMVNWEWYQDTNVKSVFIHCLFKANYKDMKWKGIEVKRGQFISSYQHLANETGLSVKKVRVAIEKLIMTNNLAKSSTSKYTVFTVINYSLYQDKGQTNRQADGQTNGKQRATSKESKERKESSMLCPTYDKLLQLCIENGLERINLDKFYETYKGKTIQVETMLKRWNDTEFDRYEPKKEEVKERVYAHTRY